MKKRIRLTESNVITKPEDIYTILSKGLFDRAIVVQGNGDEYEVINAGKIRGDGSEWMIYKDKDGSTHTWYYPYYDDIKRGSIKSITVIQESRNTNKKVIRLTESDLHRIVKESVNKVLTELDWRTYANAGKKAHDEVLDKMKRGTSLDDLRKDSDFMKRARQTRKFRDQAVASSRDKFKELNDDENDFYTTVGPDDTYYANVENDSWGRPMVADKDGKTKMQGLSRPKMVNVNPERYFGYGSNEKVSDWNKFSKEINDFNSGKSKYIQGQGWQ